MPVLTPIKPHEPDEEMSFMALPGKLVREMIKRFACKEESGRFVLESLGIGKESMAATDTRRAIVAGEPEDLYTPTDRRCALLEAERALIYNEGYNAGNVLPVEDMPTDANKPPTEKYPGVGQIVRMVDDMDYLGTFAPEFLRDAAAIGIAAGAIGVELYLQKKAKGDHTMLGFRVSYTNEEPSFGEAFEVPLVGLIMSRTNTRKKLKDASEGEEETGAGE